MQNLISSKFKFVFVLFFYVFSLVVLAGGTSEQADTSNTELAPLIQHLSSRFFDGKLTVNDLQNELSGTAEQSGNKESWYINSDKYKVRVTAEAQTENSAVSELQFYPGTTKQLELKDLERMFGDSRVFMQSINTWVAFDLRKSQNDRQISITAQLYAPPESGVSPVITVKLSLE